MSDFIRSPAEDNILYSSFKDRLRQVTEMSDSTKEELCREVKKSIEDVVYPAYRKLLPRMKALMNKAESTPGVWRLPDGDAYYRYCLRFHTITDMTPEEIYQLGAREVRRIQHEMTRIMKQMGLPDAGSFENRMENYTKFLHDKKPELHYPDTKEGKDRAIQDFQQIIDDTQKKLPECFSLIPETPVIVKASPDFKKSVPTHYTPSSLDGKREGIFYFPMSSPPSKAGLKTVAFHEAVPGHHFQLAIQKESSSNLLIRN